MNAMEAQAVKVTLGGMRQATIPGTSHDGTRIHIQYKAFREPTDKAKTEATRATELGLPTDHYTGRVDKIYESKSGDMILTMYVELERDHTFRSFNIDKGQVFQIVVLGD